MNWLQLTLYLASLFTHCMQSADGNKWVISEQMDNVELHAQFPTDSRVIWHHLKSVSDELTATLNVKSSGDPIQILIFADQRGYLEHLMATIPLCRHKKAIFVRVGHVSRIYAYQTRSLNADLRHEMTHALLHQHLPFLPLWLDEGLAEYFEEDLNRGSSSRASNLRWKARVGWRPSLKSLEAIPSVEKMDADDYRDSWAWACLLMNESPESRQLLVTFLERIRDGKVPLRFSDFAETEIPDFSKRAISYFRKIPIRAAENSTSPLR